MPNASAVRGSLLAAMVLVAMVPSALAAPAGKPAAIVIRTPNLGKVIATPGRLAIYYWDTEKKAGGKIRCTGSCAVQWPPVFVKAVPPRHVSGVRATFGTVRRAGKLQLTVNGLPAYTYQHDTAGVVLCDNVDGWHAVRARA